MSIVSYGKLKPGYSRFQQHLDYLLWSFEDDSDEWREHLESDVREQAKLNNIGEDAIKESLSYLIEFFEARR